MIRLPNLLKNRDKNENFSEVSINNEKYIECTISSDVLKPKFDINKNIILGALVSKEKFFADFSNESMDADGNTYIFDNNGRLIEYIKNLPKLRIIIFR